MIKVTILLYAILLYPDGLRQQQVISWNLPFQSYENCEKFYNENQKKLKDGVVVHGNSEYEEGMTLSEMGCTKVVISGNGDIPRDNPNDREAHYLRGHQT